MRPGWVIAALALAACSSHSTREVGESRDPLLSKGLLVSNLQSANDAYGRAVAVAGVHAAVGAPGDGNGKVVIFDRHPQVGWNESQILTAVDTQSPAFGVALAMEGTTLLIGADAGGTPDDGAAYVFKKNAGSWTEAWKMTPVGASNPQFFGYSVSLSGNTALVGCLGEDAPAPDSGAAYVFVEQAGAWIQQARLVPNDPQLNVRFGSRVFVSGDQAFVGTLGDPGAVYVFTRSGTVWSQTAKLTPPDAGSQFGRGLARSGPSLLVGATSSGVYEYTLGSWAFVSKIVPPGTGKGFADALAADADHLLVGMPGNESTLGAIALYARSGNAWTMSMTANSPDGEVGDYFGTSVALSGSHVVAGAPENDSLGPLAGVAASFVIQEGIPCTSGLTCPSGFCVNGVCCDSACTDPCATCLASQGATEDGVCGVASSLQAPPACGGYACDGKGTTCPTSCVAGTCHPLYYCDASSTCVPVKQHGEPCQSSDECNTAACVDGVCCLAGCVGCSACIEALTGAPDGECAPVFAGTDPNNKCPQDLGFPASCKADGLCDGIGDCRVFAPPTTACGATTCEPGNQISGMLCNGLGTCAPGTASCGTYPCLGTSCTKQCVSQDDCTDIGFCSAAGTCENRRPNGAQCSEGYECQSYICADGVCCNTTCDGQCEWCADPFTLGVCVAVLGYPPPGRPPCAPSKDVCAAKTCDGEERAFCAAYAGGDVICKEASCNGGIAQPAVTCDGKGQCPEATAIECGAYACDETACKSSCTSDADCSSGNQCDVALGKCGVFASCESETISLGPEGARVDCTPYRCGPGGACFAACSSSLQCVAGYHCSSAGVCAPRTEDEASGCACRAAGANPNGRGDSIWLLALGLIAFGARAWRRQCNRSGDSITAKLGPL
jgi:hypothetical protein